MKQCKYCEKFYPEDAFGVALTTPNKVFRRRKCRNCYQATKRALYKKHYLWINAYKSEKGCCKCGIKNPIVLDFHHTDESSKDFGISGRRREVGFKKLTAEIEKCEIICSNCHRIQHYERGWKNKRAVVYR